MKTIIISVILITYLFFGIKFQKNISKSILLNKSQKIINSILIWIIPFFWYWMIKDMLNTTGTMTKDKRKIDRGYHHRIDSHEVI